MVSWQGVWAFADRTRRRIGDDQTAGFHRGAKRRGSVAAGGTGAAAGDAGGRVSRYRIG